MKRAKTRCAVEGCKTYIHGDNKSGVCFRHMHSAPCRCGQCRGVAPLRKRCEDGIPRAYRLKTREELGLPVEGAWREWHGGKLLAPWEIAERLEGAA